MENKLDKYFDLAHQNLADDIEYRVRTIDGGDLYKTENYMLYTIGVNTSDGHLNGVISFNDNYAEEIVNEAERFFSDKGSSYSYWIRNSKDSNLEELLIKKGLKPKRKPGSSIMAIDQRVQPIDLPKGYTIKTVDRPKGIKDFGIVIKDAFNETDKVINQMFNSKKILSPPKVIAFIIYNNKNKPVSAALTTMSEKVAGIYYVGTREKYRGLGLGTAIVEATTNVGFDSGKEAVILQASEVGEIVYKKLGYKRINYYRSYLSRT